MIQRIQSVYLLCAVALLVASLCLPLGYFTDSMGVVYTLTPLAIDSVNVSQATWGLFCLLLLSAIVGTATILLFKNRPLQMRMTIFNIILLVGYYITFFVFYWILKSDLEASFRIHWALSFPLVAMVLIYLAFRAIAKDEIMVKAADRLR